MDEDSIHVIGAGLMRTGTMSLKLALERLLGVRCHHMQEVFKHPHTSFDWVRILTSDTVSDADLRHLMKGYGCCVDYPSVIYFKQLMEIYPNAKVILTERDPDSWVRSIRQTTVGKGIIQRPNMFRRLVIRLLLGLNYDMTYLMHQRITPGCQDYTDDDWKNFFVQWNEDVKRHVVPNDRLLVFQAKQGWEPLCEFLKVSVPEEAFPFVNTTDEFKAVIVARERANRMGLGVMTVIGASVIGLVAYYLYKL